MTNLTYSHGKTTANKARLSYHLFWIEGRCLHFELFAHHFRSENASLILHLKRTGKDLECGRGMKPYNQIAKFQRRFLHNTLIGSCVPKRLSPLFSSYKFPLYLSLKSDFLYRISTVFQVLQKKQRMQRINS